MGINISGNTDIISATDGSLTIQGADFTAIAAGSTAAPSISPTGDTNTGIFFPSADTIAIAEGGSEALRIDSSGNLKLSTAATSILNSSGNKILNQTGSILQVVQSTKTDSFTTTSTDYVTPTGLSVSITPSSTSSKILVHASISFMISGDSGHAYARILRDSTSIFNADSAGSRNTATFVQNNSGGNGDERAAISFVDSPSSISALSYSIRVKSSNGTTVYVNRSPRDNDGSQYDGRSVSSIVVMEISG